MPMTEPTNTPRTNSIYHRILFILVVFVGGTVPLVANALDDVDGGTKVIASISLWALWAVLLTSVAIPSSITLTALRLAAPAHAVIVIVTATTELDAGSAIAVVLTAATTSVAFMAEIGSYFVQRSAYGDEQRFLLRCPAPMAIVQILMWALWVSSAIVGALALVNEAWVAGGVLVALAIGGLVFLPQRFHRLSRRWLVKVPAGIVVHDHVLLAETAMFARNALAAVEMTRGPIGDDADLAGGGRTPGLRITLHDFDTVVMAASAGHPGGRAIHVRSFRIRPSRPGRALRALQN